MKTKLTIAAATAALAAGAIAATGAGATAPTTAAPATTSPTAASPAATRHVEGRVTAINRSARTFTVRDALGADVDASTRAEGREGDALELRGRGHLDLERPALGVADGEGARRAIDRGDATLDVARGQPLSLIHI